MTTLIDHFPNAGCYAPQPLAKASGHGEGSRGGKIIGHTKSGKAVYGRTHATYHGLAGGPWADSRKSDGEKVAMRLPEFSQHDHQQAADLHYNKHLDHQHERWKSKNTADAKADIKHAEASSGHLAASVAHLEAAHQIADSLAAQELESHRAKAKGSDYGEIAGHTASGKPIYMGRKADHPSYGDFSEHDHRDAVEVHGRLQLHHHNAHRHAFANGGNDDSPANISLRRVGLEHQKTAHLHDLAGKSHFDIIHPGL